MFNQIQLNSSLCSSALSGCERNDTSFLLFPARARKWRTYFVLLPAKAFKTWLALQAYLLSEVQQSAHSTALKQEKNGLGEHKIFLAPKYLLRYLCRALIKSGMRPAGLAVPRPSSQCYQATQRKQKIKRMLAKM